MNFKEFTLLFIVFIISIIFRFVYPVKTVEDMHAKMAIDIVVINQEEKTISFDDLPTIKEVLDTCHIQNRYGFDESYILDDGDTLYIPSGHISLNHASKEELMTLKGVGEKRAESILEYRKKYGFKRIEDIQKISGIGEKTYLKLREYLCL